MDFGVTAMGLVVGMVVGLTGMGGGALMTPLLVLFFGVQPLAAVSSDLVAAVVMKPVGGSVDVRRGTVNLQMVKWLALGSVPSAFRACTSARGCLPAPRDGLIRPILVTVLTASALKLLDVPTVIVAVFLLAAGAAGAVWGVTWLRRRTPAMQVEPAA